MKTFSKLFAISAVAVLVVATALLPRQAHALGNHYTDTQIFEGVMLGHGPVAAVIPEIGAGSAWSVAQVRDAQALEGAIQARHPAFLAHFGAEMRSGDPGRITRAFEGARKFAFQMHYTGGPVKDAARGVVMDTTNAGYCLIATCDVVYDYWDVAVVQPLMADRGFLLERLARSIAVRLDS